MLPNSDVSRGFLLRTGSKAIDSRFSVTFFAQAKQGDQLTSESMSCLPVSRLCEKKEFNQAHAILAARSQSAEIDQRAIPQYES